MGRVGDPVVRDQGEHWMKSGCGAVQLYAPEEEKALQESTESTFHVERSWLKRSAPENIALILVTAEVSHPPMSWLKDEASSNISLISVTLEVHDVPSSVHLDSSSTSANSPARSRLVYVTPSTSPVSPTCASGREDRDLQWT